MGRRAAAGPKLPRAPILAGSGGVIDLILCVSWPLRVQYVGRQLLRANRVTVLALPLHGAWGNGR